MEDNKNPKGAAPKASPCCLPFGKDFLCFWSIFGTRSGSILTKFADSVNLFSQEASLKGLPATS